MKAEVSEWIHLSPVSVTVVHPTRHSWSTPHDTRVTTSSCRNLWWEGLLSLFLSPQISHSLTLTLDLHQVNHVLDLFYFGTLCSIFFTWPTASESFSRSSFESKWTICFFFFSPRIFSLFREQFLALSRTCSRQFFEHSGQVKEEGKSSSSDFHWHW